MLAFATARRTSEIRLRMALGAARRNVLALVGGDGMRVTIVATLAGLTGAVALGRVATSLLFEISPYDDTTFVVSVLAATCLLASYVPARRAARIDPAMAIRHE